MSQFKGNTRDSLIPVVPRAIYSKENEKNASSAKLSLKSMKSLCCCGILLFCLFFIVVLLFLLWPRNPVLVITNFSLNNAANSNGSFNWIVGAVLESRNFYDLPFTQVDAKVLISTTQDFTWLYRFLIQMFKLLKAISTSHLRLSDFPRLT